MLIAACVRIPAHSMLLPAFACFLVFARRIVSLEVMWRAMDLLVAYLQGRLLLMDAFEEVGYHPLHFMKRTSLRWQNHIPYVECLLKPV